MGPCVYLIGSLRNPRIPEVAAELRTAGYDVFDDWFSAGERADDSWQEYETGRGRTYKEALRSHHALSVFEFDQYHLNRAHGGVLVYPAGKSAHIELGHLIAQGKPGFILLDGDPERFDVMTQFATAVATDVDDLLFAMEDYQWPPVAGIPAVPMGDAFWLAGLLEGEGCFTVTKDGAQKHRPRPRIALAMTDEDVLRRAAGLLGVPVFGPYQRGAKKPVWCCAATGIKAAEWMRVLKPYMGVRRRARINEVLAEWNPYHYRRWSKTIAKEASCPPLSSGS